MIFRYIISLALLLSLTSSALPSNQPMKDDEKKKQGFDALASLNWSQATFNDINNIHNEYDITWDELFEYDNLNPPYLQNILSMASQSNNISLLYDLFNKMDNTNKKKYANYTLYYGLKYLHLAARDGDLGIVKTLIAHNANVNATTWDGWTPLHLAAFNGNLDIVQYLLNNGAQKFIENNQGKTAFDVTQAKTQQDYFKTFPTEVQNSYNIILSLLPLQSKSEYQQRGFALLEKIDWDDITFNEIKNILQANQIDIQELFDHKFSNGNTILHRLVTVNNTDALKDILDAMGANVGKYINVKNAETVAPLHFSSAKGHLDAIKLLIEHGADPNVVDQYNMSPLHVIIFRIAENQNALKHGFEIAKFLISKGADKTIRLRIPEDAEDWVKKFNNKTPIDIAKILKEDFEQQITREPQPSQEELLKINQIRTTLNELIQLLQPPELESAIYKLKQQLTTLNDRLATLKANLENLKITLGS